MEAGRPTRGAPLRLILHGASLRYLTSKPTWSMEWWRYSPGVRLPRSIPVAGSCSRTYCAFIASRVWGTRRRAEASLPAHS